MFDLEWFNKFHYFKDLPSFPPSGMPWVPQKEFLRCKNIVMVRRYMNQTDLIESVCKVERQV